jgi:hypothetical protein
MGQFHQLKKLLDETPYLVADALSGSLFLGDQGSVFDRLTDASRTHVIYNLGAGLERAGKRLGTTDRDFGLKELAAFAGMSYQLAYHYVVTRKVIVPSVRGFGGSGQGDNCEGRFAWLDAYSAELVGILRRAGLGMKTLKKVQPLLARLVAEQADLEPVTSGASQPQLRSGRRLSDGRE